MWLVPTFPRAGPRHPEQELEALPCTPDPSEGQEDSIADDLSNSQALVWALAEVPLPGPGAVSPQAGRGEARPPLGCTLSLFAQEEFMRARPGQANAHPASKAPD